MKEFTALILIPLLYVPTLSAAEPDDHSMQSMPTFTWDIRFGFSATGTYVYNPQADGKKLDGYTRDTQVGHFYGVDGYYTRRYLFLKTGVELSKTGPRFMIPFTSSYNSTIIGLEDDDIKENLSDFIWGWTLGLTIRTGRTMIDFEYERGISNISRGFEGECIKPAPEQLKLNRRLNILSFSYGITF